MKRFSKKIKTAGRSVVSATYHGVGRVIGQSRAQVLKRTVLASAEYLQSKNTDPRDVEWLSVISKTLHPLKLHFGSDTRVLAGWVNIDISPWNKAEDYAFPDPEELRGTRKDYFVIDFREGHLPITDNSTDVIFHEDFIEHLTEKEMIIFLAETYRILKPGGVHRINTPELLSSLRKHSDFKKGFSGVSHEEWDRFGHHVVLTRNLLKEIAETIGYTKIHFNRRNESISKLIPAEYRPGSDRTEEEQIFCDLVK